MTDYAHTGFANRARRAKATKLAQLAWMRDWAFIVGAEASELRDLRLELGISSVSAETWQLAHDLLVRARAEATPPSDLAGSTQ